MPFEVTSILKIANEDRGPSDGFPVILLHGWPDDVRTYDRVVPVLNAAGFRTVVPYLRGFGDTSFLSREAMRSGEIVAMVQDAIDLADALNLGKFAVIGHDWGARIAYALAIAISQRVSRVVTIAVGWQSGELPPCEFRLVLRWQMLLDQDSNVGQRFQCQQIRDGQGSRQGLRPIGTGHSLVLRDTRGLQLR
jgi:pimeloyl-ACP methyl ester carboxylesterase